MLQSPSSFTAPEYVVQSYELRIRALDRIAFPRERAGTVLRGGFGVAFHRLVCHDREAECRACMLGASCPYARVFAPSPPPGAERLRLQSAIPRPFILAPDLEAPESLGPGDETTFRLALIGDSATLLPYFVVAFRALGDQGLGRSRGRFTLLEVVALGEGTERAAAYHDGEPVVRAVILPLRPGAAAATSPVGRLTVRFLTPTALRAAGELVEAPAFHHLVKRLRDRVSATHYFYCGGPWDVDHAALGELAEGVSTVSASLRWIERSRRSTRTGQVHPLSGFVGEATYEGDLAPFLPLLRIGEHISVGKAATFGNGRIEVEVPRA